MQYVIKKKSSIVLKLILILTWSKYQLAFSWDFHKSVIKCNTHMFSLFISPSDVFIETKPQFFSGGGTILPLQNRPLLQSNILNGSLRIFGTCSVLGHLLFSINILSQDRLLYLLKRRCRLSLHHSNCRTTSHLSCSAEYHILLVPA